MVCKILKVRKFEDGCQMSSDGNSSLSEERLILYRSMVSKNIHVR
jgi:hypothetical protein